MSFSTERRYTRAMPGTIARAGLVILALIVAASIATAQTTRQKRQQRAVEPAVPAVSVDARDSVVAAPGAFNGRPYWLALAQCGGIYFKLNTLYTDVAVHARVVKPNPTTNAEFTRKLNDAIKAATTLLNGAEHFLMTNRGVERADAVLTYEGQMRAAGDRLKTIEAALAAAKACPTLYQACRDAHPKECGESLIPAR
ncbi:MAG: hypothetical protein WBD95_15655 [Xanthobacteraceae bacterium]